MAKSLVQLKIFFSSTSELEAERLLFKEVVDDVNEIVEQTSRVTFRLIDWKQDLVPGIGSDPQDVINRQSKEYQIYIGMLGTRFGTATPRAGSGTEDEFNEAYARYREDPRSIRILFYFKTGLVGNVHNIDTAQLEKVLAFKERLSKEKGVLYREFSTPEDFRRLARTHLIKLLSDDWAGKTWKPVPGLEPLLELKDQKELEMQPEAGNAETEDELGLLDLRVEMDESFETSTKTLLQISKHMRDGGQADHAWRLEAEELIRTGAARNPKQSQELVNKEAKSFETRAREIRPLRATFKSSADQFFERLGQIIVYQIKSGTSSKQEMLDNINKLAKIDALAREARDEYTPVAATLASLPALTRDFKKSQRMFKSELDQLSAAIGSWLDRSEQLRKKIESLDETSESDA